MNSAFQILNVVTKYLYNGKKLQLQNYILYLPLSLSVRICGFVGVYTKGSDSDSQLFTRIDKSGEMHAETFIKQFVILTQKSSQEWTQIPQNMLL